MVAHRQVFDVPSYSMRVMIWAGLIVPCSVSRRRTAMSVIEPLPWLPRIGMPLIFAMSTALPDEWCETLPRRGVGRVAALQRGDRRPHARRGEELERGEHAPVDAAAADVAAAAAVDLDPRVAEDAALEVGLAHEQDLADRRGLASRPKNGFLFLAR